jgi:voltage-dependent calcium channel L type alpha-1D
MKMLVKARPNIETTSIPKNCFRKVFHKIGTSGAFDIFIMACIILNMLTMAMEYETQSSTYAFVVGLFNTIFTIIFILEFIIKFIGLGISYFYNGWNLFDFTVVAGSVVDFTLS